MSGLLSFCGFAYFEFFSQVNGLFDLKSATDVADLEAQLASVHHWNIVIASRSPAYFQALDRPLQSDGRLRLPRLRDDRWQGLHQAPKRDDPRFVIHLFETLLRRHPGDEGLAHYVGKLARGVSREQVYVEIRGSQEYRERAARGNLESR